MDIYEDSMPLRFTPDGLDESTIDALIEQECPGFDATPFESLTELANEPVRYRVTRPAPHDEAA